MTEELVIVGCGGHGREAFGIGLAVNAVSPTWRVLGFVDDKPSTMNRERVSRLGVPLLGPVDWLGSLPSTTRVVLGVGDPLVRLSLARRIAVHGLAAGSLIHPTATLAPDLVAGEGLLVFAGVRVTTNVVLGRHVHLNQNATVGHDCTLGDYVSVNPLAAVSGDCRVEAGVLIGTTATVLQGRHVGERAVVGAGACVVHDVGAGTIVKGIPAR